MSETRSGDLSGALPLRDLQPRGVFRLLAPFRGPLISAAVIVGLVAAWEAGVRLFDVPDFILPAPSAIFTDTAGLGWTLAGHTEATLVTILAGFFIALAISLPLSIAITSSRTLSHAIYPLLVIKQSVPVVALAPILIVVLGSGAAPRIAITVLIALFPLVVSMTTGLAATATELVDLSRAMGASWLKQMIDIRLPSAVPYIFSGLKVSMTLSVVGAVVGEFVAAERGLGYLIYTSTAYFHVSIAFGGMIVLSLIGLVLFQTLVQIERRFFAWSIEDGRLE